MPTLEPVSPTVFVTFQETKPPSMKLSFNFVLKPDLFNELERLIHFGYFSEFRKATGDWFITAPGLNDLNRLIKYLREKYSLEEYRSQASAEKPKLTLTDL
jgi:hypothetical protein